MHLVPKTDDPLYINDRFQCTICQYVFLPNPHIFFRILAFLRGETCPNCGSRDTVRLGASAPHDQNDNASAH